MYVLIHKTTLDLKYIAVHGKETLDNAKDIPLASIPTYAQIEATLPMRLCG